MHQNISSLGQLQVWRILSLINWIQPMYPENLKLPLRGSEQPRYNLRQIQSDIHRSRYN